MTQVRSIGIWLLLCVFGCPAPMLREISSPSDAKSRRASQSPGNGEHDFDFLIGTWRTHISRLEHPLAHSKKWISMDGVVQVRRVWQGGADLGEVEAEGSGGRFEGLTLRLYDPQLQQWRLYFANSRDGALAKPMIGEFKNGRGEFYDQELLDGKAMYFRNVYFDITPNSYRFEQAFSDDGGLSWAPNFTASLTRLSREVTEIEGPPESAEAGQHDFDWQFGRWNVHMSRLEHPLTGSNNWTPLDGTVVVRKIWNGRANLAEIDVAGPSGRLEFLSLRLYDPQTKEWTLRFASSNIGDLSAPMYGDFRSGRGVFYDQEPYNGRSIWVRFVFDHITANSGRDEQSFSVDGGKTWELNWINKSVREKS
jgi:hypothetical protein